MSYHTEELEQANDQIHWSGWTTRAPRRGLTVAYMLAGGVALMTAVVLILG